MPGNTKDGVAKSNTTNHARTNAPVSRDITGSALLSDCGICLTPAIYRCFSANYGGSPQFCPTFAFFPQIRKLLLTIAGQLGIFVEGMVRDCINA